MFTYRPLNVGNATQSSLFFGSLRGGRSGEKVMTERAKRNAREMHNYGSGRGKRKVTLLGFNRWDQRRGLVCDCFVMWGGRKVSTQGEQHHSLRCRSDICFKRKEGVFKGTSRKELFLEGKSVR